MKELKFKVWHKKEKKMYYRGYQKLWYVLLCEDDHGDNDGKGRPVKRASYEDCELLESTTFFDKNRREIYEGDRVRIVYKGKVFEGEVDFIPDMFGSKNIHPLQSVLIKHGITGNPENLDVELIGSRYESWKL
jgi:uncharacterized phage protein (TIGR01671 family)